MSKRQKTIILFSRNGIKIIKTENIDSNCYHNKTYSYEESLRYEQLEKISHEAWGKSHYEDVRYESKLGFYYYKREYIQAKQANNDKGKYVTYKKHIIWLDGEKYELEYPIEFNSPINTIKVNKYDNRPWDIVPGYKGIPDHFIIDLYKESLKFLDILDEYKKILNFRYNGLNHNLNEIKKNILINLFGDEDGPKQQPNDIKILSHGFDLKESFRKRKEN